MKDVDLHGIHKVTQMALKRICPGNKRPLHVSYDIDALDVNEVITTGTPGRNKYWLCNELDFINSISP